MPVSVCWCDSDIVAWMWLSVTARVRCKNNFPFDRVQCNYFRTVCTCIITVLIPIRWVPKQLRMGLNAAAFPHLSMNCLPVGYRQLRYILFEWRVNVSFCSALPAIFLIRQKRNTTRCNNNSSNNHQIQNVNVEIWRYLKVSAIAWVCRVLE